MVGLYLWKWTKTGSLLVGNEAKCKCNLWQSCEMLRVSSSPRWPGLCLLLSDTWSEASLACLRSLPPLPKINTVVLHWLSVWQVPGGGLWQACHGYHHLWRWLPSREHAAAPTSTKLGDEFNSSWKLACKRLPFNDSTSTSSIHIFFVTSQNIEEIPWTDILNRKFEQFSHHTCTI